MMDIKPPADSDPVIQEAIEEAAQGIDVRPPEFSDDALALQFSGLYEHDLRYVPFWGWMRWNGTVWLRLPTKLAVFAEARQVCRSVAATLEVGNHPFLQAAARQIASSGTMRAVERVARSDQRHAATVDQWDRNEWALNTPAGIVNLRTGELELHNRLAYCSKLAPVAPGGDCPQWMQFLDEITAGDPLLQDFLKRVAGYCLTGSTRDHALFFLHGLGANGKGVFVNTLSGILGDYATTAPIETFVESNQDRHSTELAKLKGARMVNASETSGGRAWNEAKIKLLTGGDTITARFMRQDFFDYIPQFKLVISGNYRPDLRNVDEAIRRRLHLIPFAVTIPKEKRDPDLTEKLKEEWPGILRWAIEGCSEWQQIGLAPPDCVRTATEEYLDAENTIEHWISECCEVGSHHVDSTGDLFQSFRDWCRQAGEHEGTQKHFSQALTAHSFKKAKEGGRRVFIGIRLKPRSLSDLRV